jgi:hypothetical protein
MADPDGGEKGSRSWGKRRHYCSLTHATGGHPGKDLRLYLRLGSATNAFNRCSLAAKET